MPDLLRRLRLLESNENSKLIEQTLKYRFFNQLRANDECREQSVKFIQFFAKIKQI